MISLVEKHYMILEARKLTKKKPEQTKQEKTNKNTVPNIKFILPI